LAARARFISKDSFIALSPKRLTPRDETRPFSVPTARSHVSPGWSDVSATNVAQPWVPAPPKAQEPRGGGPNQGAPFSKGRRGGAGAGSNPFFGFFPFGVALQPCGGVAVLFAVSGRWGAHSSRDRADRHGADASWPIRCWIGFRSDAFCLPNAPLV